MQAEASIYLDKLRPRKDGSCAVKIRITFMRKRKYYLTGIDLEPLEFEKVMFALRRTPMQKENHTKLNAILTKAQEVIKGLTIFTFASFDEHFYEQRNIQNSVSFAFEKYIKELKEEKRIGTAENQVCSINSIEKFKKNLTFAEVTPSFLKKYERWMLENGKSITTVGMYLRNLRTIFNQQNIDSTLYPFGKKNNKYSIPTSRNIKKALVLSEISNIFQHEITFMSTKDMARDYWIFLYLCNGMNVKDFCNLKWSNIDEDLLTYHREKTKRSKSDHKAITVSLKPESKAIIKKWSIQSLKKDAYVFPHFRHGMTPEKERATHKQLTKLINKYMEEISKEIGIDKKVTTYFARHSFATVLKRSGTSTEMIGELLGHQSVDVTKNYLDGFEKEQIQKETDALTIGFKKAE